MLIDSGEQFAIHLSRSETRFVDLIATFTFMCASWETQQPFLLGQLIDNAYRAGKWGVSADRKATNFVDMKCLQLGCGVNAIMINVLISSSINAATVSNYATISDVALWCPEVI